MAGGELNRDFQQWDDVFPDAGNDLPWDDGDGLEPGLLPDDVWDAFELDDGPEEPEPEYGDFWPEIDDREGFA